LSLRLLLSCGEASGDLYAGALTRELRALEPSIAVAGLGGPQLEAAGGHVLDDYRELSVTGLVEWIPKLPRLLAARRKLVDAARAQRPDALVLIDFSGFNFRLAPAIKRLGVPVIYYISPQIWASRPGRLATMRAIADRVLVIFPFEAAIYEHGGVPVEFVGHPLIDLTKPSVRRDSFLTARGLRPSAATVAILPGSRPNEVSCILPTLVAAAGLIQQAVPDVQFVVARAPRLDDALFDTLFDPARSSQAGGVRFTIVEGDTDTVLASSDAALTASGTATVQAALHDTPMVVVYRMTPLSFQLARRVVKVEAIAMVNLIAGEKIVPELVQDAFTAEAVAREAIDILTNPARAARIRDGLASVRAKLGGSGASRRAAEAILRVVRSSRQSSVVSRQS
jgi:lipid-A-disaccharide synthase